MSSSSLYNQIYQNLKLKETDELLGIWQKNNHYEWTDEAFEAIHEILQERQVEIPPQDDPIYERPPKEPYDELDEDSPLRKYITTENAPLFYEPLKVLRLEKWLHWAAIICIIISTLENLWNLRQLQLTIASYFTTNFGWYLLSWLVAFFITVTKIIFLTAIIYFPMKALGEILKILMEMEFRSRDVIK